MSDSSLRLIPTQPTFRPTPKAAESARALLSKLVPNANEVGAQFLDEVEFVDSGQNWAGVKCPHCGHDLEDWWLEAMDTAAESSFTDLAVQTPCCAFQTSLNDLNYVRPAGLCSFVLEAMNPNVSDFPADQIGQIEAAIGCPMRVIWCHL